MQRHIICIMDPSSKQYVFNRYWTDHSNKILYYNGGLFIDCVNLVDMTSDFISFFLVQARFRNGRNPFC